MFKKILETIKEIKSDMSVYYREISKGFIEARIIRLYLQTMKTRTMRLKQLFLFRIEVNHWYLKMVEK